MSAPVILVPTDFSEHAEHALVYAASLGERFGATIHLLHVVTLHEHEGKRDEQAFPDLEAWLARADRAARASLDAGALHGGEAETRVQCVSVRGFNAYEAILDHAGQHCVDLIVMATRGNTGLAHAMLGSTTERVLRFAPCPVLVVEKGDRDFVDPETMAVRLERVVFAHDLSDKADASLRRAVDTVRPYAPEVHVVHAVDEPVPALYTLAGITSLFKLHPDLAENVQDALRERVRPIVPAGWALQVAVREGRPHRVVADYAEEVGAHLLVLAAETRTDLAERVLGGTAERIVRQAGCPTLVL